MTKKSCIFRVRIFICYMFFSIFVVHIFRSAYVAICFNRVKASASSFENKNENKNIDFKDDFIGVWFSFIDWQKCCNFSSKESFVEGLEKNILPNLKKLKINNVMLHAVSFGDSFYISKFYPMSELISFGKKINYDPYKIFVDILKKNKIKVHAWINPLRSMTDKEFKKTDNSYQTKRWYVSKDRSDYYMKDKRGRYWLNPSNPEVITFLEKVAREILEKYDVSSLHIDDYFYPLDICEDDLPYYNKKSKRKIGIKQWRLNSVFNLVKSLGGVSSCFKKKFGVSPQGNMNDNLNRMFFDQREIIKRGYLDYIIPQIYYGFNNECLPFDRSVKSWENLVLECSVGGKKPSLYIGLAACKCGLKEDIYAKKGKDEWFLNSDILKRQIEFLKKTPNCDGYCFFAYNNLFMPQKDRCEFISKEVKNLINFFQRKITFENCL